LILYVFEGSNPFPANPEMLMGTYLVCY